MAPLLDCANTLSGGCRNILSVCWQPRARCDVDAVMHSRLVAMGHDEERFFCGSRMKTVARRGFENKPPPSLLNLGWWAILHEE